MKQRMKQFVTGICASLLLVTGFSGVASAQTINTSNTQARYVALGDSVAAGLGLNGTPTTGEAALCGRSAEAYANKVAADKQLKLTNVACSGATAGDLFTSQDVNGQKIGAQLNAAFGDGTPKYMSITAGANDAHWATFIGKCLADTCGSSSDDMTAAAYRAFLQAKLYYAFANIRVRTAFSTPPKVVITGYYNPTSPACSVVDQRLSADEVSWIKKQTDLLNQSIQSVASSFSSFVSFAPVDFTGHDICSLDSWIQRPGDKAPFHPTAAGQAAIAQAVEAKM